MKFRKITALLCSLLLLNGTGAVAAETAAPYSREEISAHTLVAGETAQELLVNGGFEMLEAETKLQVWALSTGPLVEGGSERTEDAHSGSYALRLSAGEEVHLTQQVAISRLNSGKICELSLWAKPEKKGSSLTLTQTFGIRNEQIQDEVLEDVNIISFTDAEAGKWTQKILRFTIPERISYTAIDISVQKDEAVLIDDVSLLLEGAPPKVEKPTKKEPVLEDFEMVKNGDFEQGTLNWGVEPGQWNDFISIVPGGATGNCVKIFKEPENSGKNPQLLQHISGFEEGAEYQMHFRLKSPGVDKLESISYGFRWGVNGVRMGHDKTGNMVLLQNDNWIDVYLDSVCPPGANTCMIDFRHFAPVGYYMIDDVSVYMTKRAPYAEVETDEIFYYTEWKKGEVTVRDRTKNGALKNGRIVLEIRDGETAVFTSEGSMTGEVKKLEFPVSVLSEKGKEYTAHTAVYNETGSLLEEYDSAIYRYDRPTYLGADGVFRKPDRNGVMREYNVVIGNGVTNPRISIVAPCGVTVVQLVGGASLPLKERLDMVEKEGLLAQIVLYSGKKSGGHPEMLPHTIDKVMAVKDHPALFGYKIQDEPMQKGNSDAELALAYKTIRDLDPNHPIYTVDSGEASYERLGKFCDLMDIDVYPGKGADRATLLGEKIEAAVKAVKGRKPVGLLQQAFELDGTFPTADEFRHYAYQALLSGASSFGYHSFGESTTPLSPEHSSWPGLVKMAEWEQGFMFDSLVKTKNPMLNEDKTDEVWWRTYVLDGKIYAIVLNRQLEENTATVTLTGVNGGYGAEGYTVKRIAGGEEETVAVNGTTFTTKLIPQAAYLYEITPNTPVDFSTLPTMKFRDLTGYNWAQNAISSMENAGVVTGTTDYLFSPGEKITRGDFAYFLITALGLTGEETTSFSDVPSDAYYAKAIAAGKAVGILEGVGDNLFDPHREISRQDIMTITARGAKLVKALAESDTGVLDTFTDAGQIADYARQSVADMVNAGLILGNGDGTVNPLGYTTRAEAAVIASRIYNMPVGA
ncbi:MAG: S-layer homology domain-containing protein [Clostridia bacterium]|nr:S-layer homology domain-containing protein [Clostridia bacterium]